MEDHEIKPIIEALLFVSGDPITLDRLSAVLTGVDKRKLTALLRELKEEYERSNRGLQIVDVAGGSQIATRPEMAPWIKEMEKVKAASRLSKPGLETLAIIAYKQPVTRGEIEQIRGVDAAGVLKTLMERKLVKIVGRKEIAGRPMMYGTTREFLNYFGLPDLTALPTLKDFSDVAEAPREGEAPAKSSPPGEGERLEVGEENLQEQVGALSGDSVGEPQEEAS